MFVVGDLHFCPCLWISVRLPSVTIVYLFFLSQKLFNDVTCIDFTNKNDYFRNHNNVCLIYKNQLSAASPLSISKFFQVLHTIVVREKAYSLHS